MSYYAILHQTLPFYVIYAVLWHTMSYNVILCRTMPYYAILCHTMPYYAIPYHTKSYCTMLSHTLPYYVIFVILCHTMSYQPNALCYLQVGKSIQDLDKVSERRNLVNSKSVSELSQVRDVLRKSFLSVLLLLLLLLFSLLL